MRTILKVLVWSVWIAIIGVGWTMVHHPDVARQYIALAPEMCVVSGLFVFVIGFAVVFVSDAWIDMHFPDPDDDDAPRA